MPLPPPGTFRLHPFAAPPLTAGQYVLTGEVSGLPGAVDPLHAAVDVTAPRFALPPDQVLSTFPPNSARGAFTSRLPQVVLRRRTLPWERSEFRASDGARLDGLPEQERRRATPRPWLALVLIADGEGTLVTDVPVADCVTPGARLDTTDRDVAKGTCLEVPATVVQKVFPALQDLPLLCHVREVDLADTELAMGDDDGWMAVVLCNRLPQPGTRYTACLVNLEGQYPELPTDPPVELVYDRRAVVVDLALLSPLLARSSADAGAMGLPAGAAQPSATPAARSAGTRVTSSGVASSGAASTGAASTGAGWASTLAATSVATTALTREPVASRALTDLGVAVLSTPWHLLVRTVRFPVLATWSFTCTEAGDFQYLASNVSSRLLGHVPTGPETPDAEPLPPGTTPPGLPAERPSARPLPLVTATGHVATAHETRRGDRAVAWFRGPLAPDPVARAGLRTDPGGVGRYPLAHAADQLRRVVPDGSEDLTYAAAFEIGRLLALSRPSVVAALNQWRRQRFAAATTAALASRVAGRLPEDLRQLLERADPFLDDGDRLRGAGAGRRFVRGLLGVLGEAPEDLAPSLPLAPPGFPVDEPAVLDRDRDGRLARGLALPDDVVRVPADVAADALWAAPVTVAERDVAVDLVAARADLEDLAGQLADAAARIGRLR